MVHFLRTEGAHGRHLAKITLSAETVPDDTADTWDGASILSSSVSQLADRRQESLPA